MYEPAASCDDEGMRETTSEASWQVSVLGGVRLVDPDGADVDPGPAKCQELLGALALSVDRAVSVDTLVDLLWGDDPPRTASKTLQTYVARLRKTLGHERVARVGAAYRLDVPDEWIDVRRFRAALADGDLERALDEWNGPPLAGLDANGLRPMVDGLVEEWLVAVEVVLERSVTSDPQFVIGRLTELTARHPFREGLWALLMQALYAGGRQADALAAYRRARHHLVEELGVEPGPRLQELESRILAQDGDLAAQLRTLGAASSIPTGTVTFAYSEIDGVAGLWADHRDATGLVIGRLEQIVRTLTAAHGGHEIVSGGDTFGGAFHRAGDAVDWATALQRAVRDEEWPAGLDVRVRVGLHTGDAEERSGSYYGPTAHIAAHLSSAGNGGQTLVSASTATLLTGVEIREVGHIYIEGLAGTQPVQQLGTAEHPPLRSRAAQLGNLPRSATPLLGRAELLRTVGEVFEASSLVTLVGPGGIGKTRLAIEVARTAGAGMSGGTWLAELADVTSGSDVARSVMELMEATELPGRPILESVVAALAGRELVLVLDNCEHVVDGAADLAEAIGLHCPSVRVIATSREGLGMNAEQLVAIGPLDVTGAAVELFEQRATSLDRSFDLDEWRESVEDICRRLDGVPLAIELAAARVRSLTPADMLARLDESFGLLSGGRRRSIERHRTLRATIHWSYDLLDASEQLLFCRLSIFAGSFDLAAAERVAAGDDLDAADVGRVLGDLVERSIVVSEAGAHGRRFRLLEMMRQFGAEELAAAGNTHLIADRHARFVVDEIAEIQQLLGGRDEVVGAARLEELWPNVRAAFEWAIARRDLPLAAELVGPLAPQSFLRRSMGELSEWAEQIAAMADPDETELVARSLLWCSLRRVMTQDRETFAEIDAQHGCPNHLLADLARTAVADDGTRTIEIGPAAIAELHRIGEHQIALLVELYIGGSLLHVGQLEEAETSLDELADRLRRSGPPTYLNWTLFMLGAIAEFRGHLELAQQRYDEMLTLAVPPNTNSANSILEARAVFRRGDHVRAYELLRRYVDDELRASNVSGAGLASLEFINMAIATGRFEHAALLAGYLDQSGILDVEGRGFHVLVADSIAAIDADPAAASVRAGVAAVDATPEWALTTIRDVLDDVLDSNFTPEHLTGN